MATDALDGFSLVPLGMNCADDSEDTASGYLYKLINGTVRDGRVKTRPPFVELSLKFEDKYTEDLFKLGRFQGCKAYESSRQIVCLIGGAVFLISVETYEVECLVSQLGFMSSSVDTGYFLDAGRFFIIQDGVNLPIILDYGIARRSDPFKPYPFAADFDDEGNSLEFGEVPIGTHMATCHGRIAVAIPNSSDFVVGNIALPEYPESILFFTETNYLNGGGAFRIPPNFGNITAMGVQEAPNTAEGEGPLIVSGSRGMSWYDITLPRERWASEDISKTITVNTGASSGSAFTNINNDIVFYSKEQIRTIAHSVQNEASIISKPISREVECWLRHNDRSLDHLVFGVMHDNRYYCTVAPEIVCLPGESGEADVQFKGIVVLDFERTGGLEQTNKPAYDGLWTGLNFTGLCSFVDTIRGFAFSKGIDGINALSEIDNRRSRFDNNEKAQVMRVYPKKFTFKVEGGGAALSPKMFKATSLWASEVSGKTKISTKLRADNRKEWVDGGSATFNAKAYVPAFSKEKLVNVPHQARRRVTISGPSSSVCDEETGHISSHGYGFETCVEVEGVATIRAVVNYAMLDIDKPPEISRCESEDERIVTALEVDDYEYKIEKARSA